MKIASDFIGYYTNHVVSAGMTNDWFECVVVKDNAFDDCSL
jgi:hypothetical protein